MNENDPRVKRTRQLLKQALFDLLREKGFAAVTVRDICERATLNRATFYAHYVDKYDLIDRIMREDLEQRLAATVRLDSAVTAGSLGTLCRTVFAYLAQVQDHCKPSDQQFDPLFDQAVQSVLQAFLLRWLRPLARTAHPGQASRETTALVISWAIFGAGAQWSRGARAQSADELATQVVAMLTNGVAGTLVAPNGDRREAAASRHR